MFPPCFIYRQLPSLAPKYPAFPPCFIYRQLPSLADGASAFPPCFIYRQLPSLADGASAFPPCFIYRQLPSLADGASAFYRASFAGNYTYRPPGAPLCFNCTSSKKTRRAKNVPGWKTGHRSVIPDGNILHDLSFSGRTGNTGVLRRPRFI